MTNNFKTENAGCQGGEEQIQNLHLYRRSAARSGKYISFSAVSALSILAFFVILISTGCPATDRGVNRNANESVQVNAGLPSGGYLIEDDDFYESAEEDSVKLVKEISEKLGLAPLPKTAKPGEFEFRIWTNLGSLGDPKLLIVRSNFSAGENNADFFDINKHADPLKFRKEQLAGPKSGWNRMIFEVRSRLTTPKGLVRDPQFRLERDEGLILLEVLDKEEYRRVIYGQNTSFQDGKRLIEVCNYLASEFDINMRYRGSSATP